MLPPDITRFSRSRIAGIDLFEACSITVAQPTEVWIQRGIGEGRGEPEAARIVSKYRDGIRKEMRPVLRELYCV